MLISYLFFVTRISYNESFFPKQQRERNEKDLISNHWPSNLNEIKIVDEDENPKKVSKTKNPLPHFLSLFFHFLSWSVNWWSSAYWSCIYCWSNKSWMNGNEMKRRNSNKHKTKEKKTQMRAMRTSSLLFTSLCVIIIY